VGADYAINYKETPDWAKKILEISQNKGVDIILDPVGASYYENSQSIIGLDGRWILYGTMGGLKIPESSLAFILTKRVSIIGTTLRNRSDEFKATLVNSFKEKILPGFESGLFNIIIDQKLRIDWTDEKIIQNAHKTMDESKNAGKIILLLD